MQSRSRELYAGTGQQDRSRAGTEDMGPARSGKTSEVLSSEQPTLTSMQLKQEPLVVASTALDYNLVKGSLQNALYGLTSWPGVTLILDLIYRNETQQLAAALTEQFGDSTLENSVESLKPLTALEGIQCGDRTARASTLEEFLPAVDELYNISRIYGDATICEPSVSFTCLARY